MRMKPWKWGLALGLSGALHASTGFLFLPSEPKVQVAGGEGAEIALAGTAFTDLSAAGAPSDAAEPVTENAAAITPVEPDATAEPIEAAEAPTVEPIEQAVPQPTVTVPTESAPEAETPEPETTEPTLAEPESAEPDLAEIEPSESQEEAVAMVPIPRPTPRPHYEPPKEEPRQAQAAPRRQAAPPAQKRAERTAGSGGNDRQNARRGTTSGANTDNAAASRGTGRAVETGNAAVSNYPGKIVAKLRRALRYPRAAQRERLRGEVSVAFTVSSNGAVAGIRVVSSSGSPILDQAAIETVQRAAPFPAIPASAGRSSWPFTVPLAFIR